MKQKFLLISQVFYPDEVSTAGLFTNLCSVIAEDDFDVEVWCAQPSYSTLKHQPGKLTHNGINIRYLDSTNFQKNSILGRLSNTISFCLSVTLKLLFSKDKTPVFTHTTQPPVGILISFICRFKRRDFVYILLDIFPEGLIRLGKVSAKNQVIRFWNWLFIASLKRCTKIIVIGRDMRNWLENIYPHSHSKIEYIPLWQDDKLVFSESFLKNEYVTDYKLNDKFIVQYSGNMGLWNDMEALGKAVTGNPEDVVFMFVGGGIRKDDLFKVFKEADQRNIMFLDFQPFEKLGFVLSACHIGLVSLRRGLEGMAVPSKIYGIMSAGIPVIALVPENSEIGLIVQEERCGILIRPDDSEGLVKAILQLKNDDILRTEMGKNGRKAFEQKYSTRIIAEKYKLLLKTLAQSC